MSLCRPFSFKSWCATPWPLYTCTYIQHIISWVFFSSCCTFSSPFVLLVPFHCRSEKVITKNHTTWSILGCPEITSANVINTNLFNLVSSSFLNQEQKKAALFCAKNVTRIVYRSLALWNLLSWVSAVHIALNTAIFHVPTQIALLYLTTFLVWSLPYSFNQQHGQACHINMQVPSTRLCLSYYFISVKRH